MSLLDDLREQMKNTKKQLDENQKINDQMAKEKHKITMVMCNRHHARQELRHYEKQEKEIKESLKEFDPNSKEYRDAVAGIEVCQKEQERWAEEIESLTKDEKKEKATINVFNDQKTSIIEMLKPYGDIIKTNAGQTIDEIADFAATTPSMIKETKDEVLDNAVATLHDLNDAMDNAVHETTDKRLVAFSKLSEIAPSISRAGRDIEIASYEKDLTKAENFAKTIDKIESVIYNKKQQAKEVGKGLKSLFTNWKTSEQEAQDKVQDIQNAGDKTPDQLINDVTKELNDRKPGFLGRIARAQVEKGTKKLTKLYQEQIHSYEKTFDKMMVQSDKAFDNKYQRMEERVLDVAQHSVEKINEFKEKQIDLAQRHGGDAR